MNATRPPEVIHRLREGKASLRRSRRSLSLPEKVEQVVKLQKIELEILSRRRKLQPRERVWRVEYQPTHRSR